MGNEVENIFTHPRLPPTVPWGSICIACRKLSLPFSKQGSHIVPVPTFNYRIPTRPPFLQTRVPKLMETLWTGAGWLPGWLPIKRLHRRDNIGRRILFGDICSKLNLLNIVREIGFRRTWPTFHPTPHPSCYILVSTASSTNSSSTTAPWGCAWLWRWVADTPTHEYTSTRVHEAFPHVLRWFLELFNW